MRIVEIANATAPLAEDSTEIASGALIVTNEGRPVAALVPIENADLETVSLSTNCEFIELIERSRTRVRADGGIFSTDMRGRFE